jgi:hypothetical protein
VLVWCFTLFIDPLLLPVCLQQTRPLAVLGNVGNVEPVVVRGQPDSGTATGEKGCVDHVPRPPNGNVGSEKENAAMRNAKSELAQIQQQHMDAMEQLKQEQQLSEMKRQAEYEKFKLELKKEQEYKEDVQKDKMKSFQQALKTQSANTKSMVRQLETDMEKTDKVSSEKLKHDVSAITTQAKKHEPQAVAVAPKKQVRFEMEILICSCNFCAHLICFRIYNTRYLRRPFKGMTKKNLKRRNTFRR